MHSSLDEDFEVFLDALSDDDSRCVTVWLLFDDLCEEPLMVVK